MNLFGILCAFFYPISLIVSAINIVFGAVLIGLLFLPRMHLVKGVYELADRIGGKWQAPAQVLEH